MFWKRLGGFDEAFLSDDMEISAHLTEQGHTIRYAPDVRAWQESPANLKTFFRQRTRWFRGTMEVAFKYGRLDVAREQTERGRRSDADRSVRGYCFVARLPDCVWNFFTDFPFNVVWGAFVGFLSPWNDAFVASFRFRVDLLFKAQEGAKSSLATVRFWLLVSTGVHSVVRGAAYLAAET